MTINLVKTFVTAAFCQKHDFKGEIEINMESKIPKAFGRGILIFWWYSNQRELTGLPMHNIDIHFICYYLRVLKKFSLLKLLSQ